MEEKKQWIKPQLIILGRGTPEENVLLTCKLQTGPPSGPLAGNCSPGGVDCFTMGLS